MTARPGFGALLVLLLAAQAVAAEPGPADQGRQSADDASVAESPTFVDRAATHVTTNETIEGNLCVGSSACSSSYEPTSDVEIIDFPPVLALATCTPPSDLCASWWQIVGDEDWLLRDRSAGTIPMRVEKAAPDDSLYVGANGAIGVGVVPSDGVEVASSSPLLRIEETGLPSGIGQLTLGLDAGVATLDGQNTVSVANSLFLSTERVGVGLSPVALGSQSELTVYSPGAETTDVRIQDGSAGAGDWGDLQVAVGPPGESGYFEVEGPSGQGVLRSRLDAQSGLTLDDAGRLGVGTSSPSAALTVARSDGGAQLLVQDQSPTVAGRTLLKLVNNGYPRLVLANSATGAQWVTASAGGGSFTANRVGSGLVEMKLYSGGDMTLGGELTEGSSRTIKRDFEPVDVGRVLESVRELPIVRWTYRDPGRGLRHLGPISEDFHRAFGVGVSSGITPLDEAGVTLAAIQGLDREAEHRIAGQDREVEEVARKTAELEQRAAALEKLLSANR